MLTEATGHVEIDVPRDREGTFEPVIVKKRQRRLNVVDEIVLSLYANGLTTGEISAHFAQIYGASVSKEVLDVADGQLRLVQANARKSEERALEEKLSLRDNYASGYGGLSADSVFGNLVSLVSRIASGIFAHHGAPEAPRC